MNKPPIVLIHGLWLTPRCWENWKALYESKGHVVHTPAWPRMPGEVEEVRADPSALNGLGVKEIADHYEAYIRGLDEAPIVMGHSFGGLLTQIILDRGLGAAGVAIDPAAPKGVLHLPLAALRAAIPVLQNPLNANRTVMLTFEQFQYGFANNVPEDEARAAYDRYAIPGPGKPIFQAATAALDPHSETAVDVKNPNRAPLLLIAGTEDHQAPATLVHDNYKLYRDSPSITEYLEFPNRAHMICLQKGWEEVANSALTWAMAHLKVPAGSV